MQNYKKIFGRGAVEGGFKFVCVNLWVLSGSELRLLVWSGDDSGYDGDDDNNGEEDHNK